MLGEKHLLIIGWINPELICFVYRFFQAIILQQITLPYKQASITFISAMNYRGFP
jgi:hypothetical protein